jgi:hypothetical protein
MSINLPRAYLPMYACQQDSLKFWGPVMHAMKRGFAGWVAVLLVHAAARQQDPSLGNKARKQPALLDVCPLSSRAEAFPHELRHFYC